MESNFIYEPINEYDKKYRELHKNNVSEYFEELVEKSGVNEEENQETVKKIKKLQDLIKAADKSIRKYSNLKIFIVVLIVIAFIVGLSMTYYLYNDGQMINLVADIFIVVGVFLVGIGFIVLLVKRINLILKALRENYDELQMKHQEQLGIAWDQMKTLNNLYDWGMPAELLQKTIPIITMDKYFNPKRYDILHTKYDLPDNSDGDTSVLFVQSGEILGNPFVIAKRANHYMGSQTYTGYLDIAWTERVRNSDGSYSTIRRTQRLTASVTKPKPAYFDNSFLIYANEAAPDLKFSRKGKKLQKLSEKEVSQTVKKESRKLQKKAEKAVRKGGSFTTMTDESFDVLFGATDRNHEVQFRMLFTPLAQRQMINIIRDNKIGFGDDFDFVKSYMLNGIFPEHLNKADIDTNPNRYVSYDLAESRKIFNNYNNSYFKSIYFTFAPILAIPLYQQHKPREYIYKDWYQSNVACWEHEAIANAFDPEKLRHPASSTFNILKTKFIAAVDDADEVEVTSHGYEAIEQIEYVSVRGGDGYFHSVPVRWYRYDPVEKTTNVVVKTVDDLDRNTYIKEVLTKTDWQEFLNRNLSDEQQVTYRRNLVAYTAKDSLKVASLNELKAMLKK
ncbi:MAG: hypothetical protein GX149_04825 [Acholeplasmataceae bacterium]|jgi:hypothetical protein|nr:hypothetical protein [Acholeplasmataceae bacterium]